MSEHRQGLDEAEPELPSSTTHCTTQDQIDDRRKLEEWADRLKLGVSDVEAFCRNGFDYEKIPPNDTPNRRSMLSHLKRRAVAPSKWLMISGLFPDAEFTEPERRRRLRALYKVTTLLIKRALGREAADPLKNERSIYWDPVAEVCRELEIAQSKLSSFLKEFSGSSLTQTIDCVRAERIQKLMRRKIRSFVQEFKAQRASLVTEKQEEITSWVVWKALKVSCKWPEFCSNSWALEFGFSSYRRMT